MTLILSYSSGFSTVMVSDRLTTLQIRNNFSGIHDYKANKCVCLITHDAAVIIGYCGSSFVGGMPTDNWIAQTLSPGDRIINPDGSTSIFGGKIPCRLKLHQMCNRLRLGLANRPGGSGVTILITGWRRTSRHMIPINIQLNASYPLRSSRDLIMRPIWPIKNKIRSIGATLADDEIKLVNSMALTTPIWDTDFIVRTFRSLVKKVSRREPTVGSDTMSVVIRNISRYTIECDFEPSIIHLNRRMINEVSAELPVAYNPWLLTPGAFYAPGEATGDPGSSSSWETEGWTFIMKDSTPAKSAPSNVGWHVAQPRTKPPR